MFWETGVLFMSSGEWVVLLADIAMTSHDTDKTFSFPAPRLPGITSYVKMNYFIIQNMLIKFLNTDETIQFYTFIISL